jgi:flagellar FliL protein
MAEKETTNDEELELDQAAKPSKKKLILIIVGAVLGLLIIIGASVGLTLMLMGGDDGQQAGEEGVVEEKVVVKEALYIPIKTMTVNFADKGAAQFLQLDLSIMTYDPELTPLIDAHMPVIRNDMLNLLGSQTYKEVSTSEGKEALRGSLLLIVQKILMDQEAREGIEAIYFTKIIMQ